MTSTYPNGYGNRLVNFDELKSRHGDKMHPEFARRLWACLEAADGLVGIGGGWRSTEMQAASHERAPNTFAPPGLSFHESHPFASGRHAYAAVDTVGRGGRHDSAWNWMRDNAGRFGLKTFWNVNGEPWHVQCSDLPNGVSTWKSSGSSDPGAFVLPDGSTSVSGPDYGPHPFNDDKPIVWIGWHGDLVQYLQRVIANEAGGRIAVDGDFGPKTEGRVKDVQFMSGLPANGVVDWTGTWQMIDHLAGNVREAAPRQDAPVQEVDLGYYWIQRGDSPWAVAERVYGTGLRHTVFDPCDPPEPGFFAADHHVRLPGVPGRTTVVVPGDRVPSIIARLRPGDDHASLTERFLALNGGPHRVLNPGDLVFLDDQAR